MNISREDLLVIEQALQAAIAAETDDQEIRNYRQLLKRLHEGSQSAAGQTQAMDDGFRYDYDDASDLRG